jgi:hypothetical protein
MRLALRTIFWLTLAVAVVTGWWLERRQLMAELGELKKKSPWPYLRSARNSGEPSHNVIARRKRLVQLSEMTDDELRKLLAISSESSGNDLYSEYDLCLVEMSRRRMISDLQEAYRALMTERGREEIGQSPYNTKLLTALRRSQNLPDPLKIHVDFKRRDWRGEPMAIPQISAVVENVDVGMEEVDFQQGCDDRSGRRTRWRVHLYDERGNRVPDSNFSTWGIGGGVGTFGRLKYGEKGNWNNWLDARSYVKPSPSGQYKLQVIHTPDTVDIADEPDLTGLIVFKSDPIEVIVTQPPQPRRAFATIPLLAVLSSIWLAAVAAVFLRRNPPPAEAVQQLRLSGWPRLLAKRRDLLALTLITLLVIAWQIDITRLNSSIRAHQRDQDANWTMRLADEPGERDT